MELQSKNIYILCPGNVATGGTELLHQLSYKLKNNNKNVTICYICQDENISPVPERFEKYEINYIKDELKIEDSDENILIVPETLTEKINKFKKIKKVIWWLSVDNYLKSRHKKNLKYNIKKFLNLLKKPDVNFNDDNIYHLYQSEYAREFLESKNVKNKDYLSDYLNNIFFKENVDYTSTNRKNIILYNPVKGVEFTKKIINADKTLFFKPLEKMTPEEVRENCKHSKIYIDFGEHPGKDRFPREAAYLGCLILTGKKGSAKNNIDIPIANSFKFSDEEKNIEDIVIKIKKLLQNYDEEIANLRKYRNIIENEEVKFENDVNKIFK